MSSDIYVKVSRAGVPVYGAQNVYLQKDNMSVQEASYYGGASPYERFQMYTLAIYDIRQLDLLIDLNNIDPKTNTYYHYRVINIPENFPMDGHMEIVCDLVRGS